MKNLTREQKDNRNKKARERRKKVKEEANKPPVEDKIEDKIEESWEELLLNNLDKKIKILVVTKNRAEGFSLYSYILNKLIQEGEKVLQKRFNIELNIGGTAKIVFMCAHTLRKDTTYKYQFDNVFTL